MLGLVASLLGRVAQLLPLGDRRGLSQQMVSDKLFCKHCLVLSFSCFWLVLVLSFSCFCLVSPLAAGNSSL